MILYKNRSITENSSHPTVAHSFKVDILRNCDLTKKDSGKYTTISYLRQQVSLSNRYDTFDYVMPI